MAEMGSRGHNEGGGSPSGKGIEPPHISLPKGGGAIRGIGEKFAANPVTGTGSLTFPIAVSPSGTPIGRTPAAGLPPPNQIRA